MEACRKAMQHWLKVCRHLHRQRNGKGGRKMKYRKKPVIIEAVQFDGTDASCDWLLPQLIEGSIGRSVNKLHIKTLEGTMTADIGDYIIKGVNGEFYPCKPDIFEKTYEKVIEN